MLSFQQFIREMWNEPDDSTFTHDGHTYDLNGLLSATLGMPVHKIPVSKLIWIFKWTGKETTSDLQRDDNADLNAPILVTNLKGQLVVLDGLHRLEKAFKEKLPEINAIYVSDELLSRYRLV